MFDKLKAELPGRMIVGTNLTTPADWCSEMAFRNPFVSSRPWISGNTSGKWDDGKTVVCNSNGWPTKLAPGQIARTLFYSFDASVPRPAGDYKVVYAGVGTLNYGQAATLKSRATGYDLITVANTGPVEIDIVSTSTTNPLRNIVVIPPDDAVNTTPNFRQPFLSSLGGFKILRFMEWQVTNGSNQVHWADRSLPTDARWTSVGNGSASVLGKGIPLEIICQLCNTLGAVPWLCIPHQADDDYVTEMGQLVAANLNPSLPVAFEFSNEVWNGIMRQAAYAATEGAIFGKVPANQAAWGTTPFQWQMAWYAMRATQCFKLLEKVVSAHRLGRVLGGQCSNSWLTSWMLGFQDTHQHVDAVAVAPYMGDAITAATNLDDLFKQLSTSERTILGTHLPAQKLAAGALPLLCYECGDGSATNTQSHTALTPLVHAAAQDPRMATLYSSFFAGLSAAGVLAALHYVNTEQSNVAANQPGFGAQYVLGQSPVPPKLSVIRSLL